MALIEYKHAIALPTLTLLVLMLPSTAGLAQSSPGYTAVSGDAGSNSFTLSHFNRDRSGPVPMKALAGLRWEEKVDVPCTVTVILRDLDNGEAVLGTKPGHERDGVCGMTTTAAPFFARAIGEILGNNERQVYLTRNRRFVRGIQVCQNSGNRRIKGVRIFPARVSLAREVTVVNGRQEAKMPGCGTDEWRNPVYCEDGQIAFELKVHFADIAVNDKRHKITGFSLYCRDP